MSGRSLVLSSLILVSSLVFACGAPEENVDRIDKRTSTETKTIVEEDVTGGAEALTCSPRDTKFIDCDIVPTYNVNCRKEPCVTSSNLVTTVKAGMLYHYSKRARGEVREGYDQWIYNQKLGCWSWEGAFAHDCGIIPLL